MKIVQLAGTVLLSAVLLSGCGPATEQKQSPNSEINGATPTGTEESRAAIGVGEGNQDEQGGYPKNQANLHPDSTRKDTIRKRQ
ncbi:hypothetical protein [Salmonirosea aquatica]|uniref:Quinol oxidase subunit 4 n=1 Tax=Salmonirosea aquatica TaxID=2654236 RepID=A0A7C9BBU3_9BACT|nr:hypothetical protein [Cytophagaceae bacterium SJW1-29]